MSSLFIILDTKTNGYIEELLDILSFLSVFFSIYVITSKNPIVSVLFLIGLFLSISINLILLGYSFIGLSYLLVYVGAVSILFIFILMLINIRISELLNDTNNSIALAIFTCIFFGFPLYRILNMIYSIKDKYKKLDLSLWLNSDNISEDTLNIYNAENTNNKSVINSDKYDDFALNNNADVFNIEIIKNEDKFLDKKSHIREWVFNHKINDEMLFSTSNSWEKYLTEFNHITSIGNILYTNYSIWLIISSIILLLAMIGAIVITKKEND